MKICIVIPAYNEEQNIGAVVESIHIKGYDVVVIDDGSTDRTGAIAAEKGAFVIRHDRKNGKGFSLQKGFQHAIHHDYDGVIAMDGDGQHDAEDIVRFVEVAQEHTVSVIAGNRMSNAKGMPFVRYCTNRFMSWIISLACQQKIPDTQCGYRYIGCDILRNLDLSCSDFEIETEILMKTCKKGYKIYNVLVKTIYQDEESKINPLKDTMRFFAYFFRELNSSKKN